MIAPAVDVRPIGDFLRLLGDPRLAQAAAAGGSGFDADEVQDLSVTLCGALRAFTAGGPIEPQDAARIARTVGGLVAACGPELEVDRTGLDVTALYENLGRLQALASR